MSREALGVCSLKNRYWLATTNRSHEVVICIGSVVSSLRAVPVSLGLVFLGAVDHAKFLSYESCQKFRFDTYVGIHCGSEEDKAERTEKVIRRAVG